MSHSIGAARQTSGPSPAELSLCVSSQPNEALQSLVARLGGLIRDNDATPLLMMVFGDCAAHAELVRLLRRYLGAIEWPILWSQGASCCASPLAAIQVFSVRGVPSDLQRVMVGGRVVASCFSDGEARHCLLGGFSPSDSNAAPALQAQACFEDLNSALEHAGFGLSDIARTWFYNRDILSWYGDFNRVRTAYYSRNRFRTGSLPASTAVEGSNPNGSALMLGAWAVQPLGRVEPVEEVASPLQCPAPAYGSSFSRAVEIKSAHLRRLLISGTASIHPDGRTAYVGDIQKQIQVTMDVVLAILDSRGMGLADTTRALAYCKSPAYAPIFRSWLEARGLSQIPYAAVHCDICRDDLLFELELDACKKIR